MRSMKLFIQYKATLTQTSLERSYFLALRVWMDFWQVLCGFGWVIRPCWRLKQDFGEVQDGNGVPSGV